MTLRCTKAELENLYLNERLPYKELLPKLGLSQSGFYYIRTKYDIPSRKSLFWEPPFTKGELYNLYITKKLSIRSIEQKTGVPHTTIEHWIKKYNLSRLPIKRRGFHHTEETKRKISVANKGKIPWSKGKKFSKEYCEKISDSKLQFRYNTEELHTLYWNDELTLAQIAEIYDVSVQTVLNRMKKLGVPRRSHSEAIIGKNHTVETKRKIGDAHRGRKGKTWSTTRVEKFRKMLKERWANPEYREHSLKIMREAIKIKPTKPELSFQTFCKKHKLPFTYVGDGSFFIHGFNPDFIHSEGKKIIVEIFGDYWHDPKRKGIPPSMLEPNRHAIFKKYGWQLVVIWEHELSSPNNIFNKLRSVMDYTNLASTSKN